MRTEEPNGRRTVGKRSIDVGAMIVQFDDAFVTHPALSSVEGSWLFIAV